MPFSACQPVLPPRFRDSMVRVVLPDGNPNDALAYGVVVGEPDQVLTVLDYEDYTASGSLGGPLVYDLEVVSEKYGRFKAAVAAIDPRTSATLLWLKEEQTGKYVNLPVAEIGNAGSITRDQDVLIHGWASRDRVFTSRPAKTSPGSSDNLKFSVSEELPESEFSLPFVGGLGAVITTLDNRVLGLLGNFGSSKLVIRLGFPGMLPQAVNINTAMELQKNAINDWTQGPALVVIRTTNAGLDVKPGNPPIPLAPIEDLSLAIRQVINQAGEPVAFDDLGERYEGLYFPPHINQPDTIVTAVFPRLTSIRNMPQWAGDTVATAKWVGIQFDRPGGLPNRLLWGTETYKVEGAFELGDVSDLENAIPVRG
jgi:hypothetical protein